MRRTRLFIAGGILSTLSAGVLSTLLVAAPASATPFSCADGGISVGGGVCELTFDTSGATFTPPTGTTRLEALLIGGGGGSEDGFGGGGGQMTIVTFADPTLAVDITAIGAGGQGFNDGTMTVIDQDGQDFAALPGKGSDGPTGGTSGDGSAGWSATSNGAAGGGEGGLPTSAQNGGVGRLASAIDPADPLFHNDDTCYGGGGAIIDGPGDVGVATCGGGSVTPAGVVVDGTPNLGGGGGSVAESNVLWANAKTGNGGSGVVVIRWLTDASATVTFTMNGHGTQVPQQLVETNTTAATPPTPTAAGLAFQGWFTDPSLSTRFNFSQPITGNTTLYAGWAALAETGVSVSPPTTSSAVGLLAVGALLVALAYRRRRQLR